jgi:hypothetical protein
MVIVDNWIVYRYPRMVIPTSEYKKGCYYYEFHHYHETSRFIRNVNSEELEYDIICNICEHHLVPTEIKKLLLMTP